MLLFAVISTGTKKAVESFVRREDAERFLEDVRHDDAELADTPSRRADRARGVARCPDDDEPELVVRSELR